VTVEIGKKYIDNHIESIKTTKYALHGEHISRKYAS
jgi:hypothetical protein